MILPSSSLNRANPGHAEARGAEAPSARRAWPQRALIGGTLLFLAGFAVLSARGELGDMLSHGFVLSPAVLLVLLPFGLWSFGLRTARWHTLLGRLVPKLSPILSVRTQLLAFALALSPGRMAEVYKLRVVEESTGVEIARSLPAVLAERLTDVSAFSALALIGGWLSLTELEGGGRTALLAILGLAIVAAAFAFPVIRSRQGATARGAAFSSLVAWALRIGERLPGGARLVGLVDQLRIGAMQIASPKALAGALGFVLAARLGDVLVVYFVARAVGYPLPLAVAMLLMGLTGLAGGLSLTPGGAGAAEATLTGLALAHGLPLDAALTLALFVRALTFWLWVVLGLLVLAATLVRGLVRRPALT